MADPVTIDPGPAPLSWPAARPFIVTKPDSKGDWKAAPNLLPVDLQIPPEAPPVLRLRYDFDANRYPDLPTRFEQVFPLDAQGDGVLAPDTPVKLGLLHDDGSMEWLFEGYASTPQVDLSGRSEQVTLEAIGRPARLWDEPIYQVAYRDADAFANKASTYITTLPLRFNPDGKPNALPAEPDATWCETSAGDKYPVLVDWRLPGSDALRDPALGYPVPWTLPMAVRYLCCQHNPNEDDVKNFNFDALDPMLVAPEDPDDPAAATDLIVSDFDGFGLRWPDVLAKHMRSFGFGFWFEYRETGEEDGWGIPLKEYHLMPFRRNHDAAPAPYNPRLQPPGERLDPALTNAGALKLQRDATQAAQAVDILDATILREVCVTLSPAFAIDAGDTAADRLASFDKENEDYNPVLYREFIADEANEGHWQWAAAGNQVDGHGVDLDPVFPVTIDPATGKTRRAYVKRRRPGLATLVSRDNRGRRRRRELWVSKDYDHSKAPAVFDPADPQETSHWQRVTTDCWQLLEDRLGILLTAQSLTALGGKRALKISDPPGDPDAPFPDGTLDVVDALCGGLADPTKRVTFRLLCTIEGDTNTRGSTAVWRRDGVPGQFTTYHAEDLRDRGRDRKVDASSTLGGPADPGDEAATRLAELKALARRQRRALEYPTLAGSITVPWIEREAQIGLSVRKVAGRECSLRLNPGAPDGEPPAYPVIIGVTYTFDPGQGTTVQVEDYRAAAGLPEHADADGGGGG